MKRISPIALAAALALIASGFAGAQQQRTVARLKSVTGNVLVSQDSGLAAGAQEQRLAAGTRVLTTANSEAVIEYDDGCEVKMTENQRFEVETDRDCTLLLAEAIGGAPQAAVGPALLPLLIVPGGTVGVVVADVIENTPVSPN